MISYHDAAINHDSTVTNLPTEEYFELPPSNHSFNSKCLRQHLTARKSNLSTVTIRSKLVPNSSIVPWKPSPSETDASSHSSSTRARRAAKECVPVPQSQFHFTNPRGDNIKASSEKHPLDRSYLEDFIGFPADSKVTTLFTVSN